MAAARDAGVKVRGYVSCVIGCPYEGAVAPAKVAEVAERLADIGCYEVSLGDTIGVGTPASVQRMLRSGGRARAGRSAWPATTTTPTAWRVANVYASYEFGLRAFDTSVGGLGGCPYAKGATGNVATEDVVYLLHGLGIDTGIDLDALVDCAALDQRSNSAGRTASRVARALLAKRAGGGA